MFRLTKSIFLAIPALTFLASSASAQLLTRTWVGTNNTYDANDCTKGTPCRTWAGALAKTAPGGEIVALDSGGFGPVTITQSVRLLGPDAASANTAGNDAIIIAAGPSDVVTLRGIVVNGGNVSGTSRGVKIISAGTVILDHCEILGFGQRGISIEPTSNNMKVTLLDTAVRANLSNGIVIQPTGTNLSVQMDNVHVQQNANYGISIASGSQISVRRSVISNNGLSGFRLDGSVISSSLDLDQVEVSGNAIGIESLTGSTVRLSNTSIINNTTGLQPGGSIYSFGTNRVTANGSGNSGMSSISLQ